MPKILNADDEESKRVLLCRMFRADGHVMHPVSDGFGV